MMWLTKLYEDNTLEGYAISVGFIVASLIVAQLIKIILNKYLVKWAEASSTGVDDLLVKRVLAPAVNLMVIFGLWAAKENLVMEQDLSAWIDRLLLASGYIIFFALLIRFAQGLIDVTAAGYVSKLEKKGEEDLEELKKSVERIKKQVREISNMVLGILAILTILSNLGVDLKAIWASLGIGGIALVVAVKEPMANLVGRMYIYGTGIFDEGHFILFNEWGGTVKKIGIFRTYMELFSDMTTVSIPNANFVTGVVKSYYGRTKFMYKWDFDAPYDTSPEKIQELIKNLRDFIRSKPETNQKMCWIYLDRLDRYSKVVRVWFQVTLPDWATSLQYGNNLLHDIQEIFESTGVEFAFPTQTVELKLDGKGSSRADPVMKSILPAGAIPD